MEMCRREIRRNFKTENIINTEYSWYTIKNDNGTLNYIKLNNSKCMGFENWFGADKRYNRLE